MINKKIKVKSVICKFCESKFLVEEKISKKDFICSNCVEKNKKRYYVGVDVLEECIRNNKIKRLDLE